MNKLTRVLNSLNLWRSNKGVGSIILPAQFGKTLFISKVCELFFNKNPSSNIVIITHNKLTRCQWEYWVRDNGIYNRCKVYTDSQMLNVPSTISRIPLMIIDDIGKIHNLDKLINIPHKFILGISYYKDSSKWVNYIPLLDTISKEEASLYNWINTYKEYKVILTVPDINLYKDHDAKFWRYMRLFNNDLNIMLNCVRSQAYREHFAVEHKFDMKLVNACTFGAEKELKWRKEFIYNHPKKYEIANKILSTFEDKHCIIFSPTTKVASMYELTQFNSKLSKKIKETVMNELKLGFTQSISAVLDVSSDISHKFDVEIIHCNNSSNSLKEDRLRVINKNGLIFTLVIAQTMEEQWFKLSTLDNDYITITEGMLSRLLRGEDIPEDRIEGPEMIYNY